MSIYCRSTSQEFLVYQCLHFPGKQRPFSGIDVESGKKAVERHSLNCTAHSTLDGFPQRFVQNPQASLESFFKFHRLAVTKILKSYYGCCVDYIMSVERKNPLKRHQALNDASNGQMGEEPRSTPKPDPQPISDLRDQQRKAAHKMSRDL
jgi:hypothetical protein